MSRRNRAEVREVVADPVYNSKVVTNKAITVTNFNNRPIQIGLNDGQNVTAISYTIEANSTMVIEIPADQYLYSIVGTIANGWSESNIHELKNVNIFEGNLTEAELPDTLMNGMRNGFDKYKTADGKYKVEMVLSNSPIQFGKAGRK